MPQQDGVKESIPQQTTTTLKKKLEHHEQNNTKPVDSENLILEN